MAGRYHDSSLWPSTYEATAVSMAPNTNNKQADGTTTPNDSYNTDGKTLSNSICL